MTSIGRKGSKESSIRKLRSKGPPRRRTAPSQPTSPRAGSVILYASKPVLTVAETTPIRNVIGTMNERGFRRIPVVNPGKGQLVGLVTARDILDFFGGSGRKLIEERYGGNLLVATNSPISSVMRTDIVSTGFNEPIGEAIRIMSQKKIGGLPVIDSDKKVIGIITERDILFKLSHRIPDMTVGEAMTPNPVTISSDSTVGLALDKMLRYHFRRLPVLQRGELQGMVTMRGIIRYLGRTDNWLLQELLSLPITSLSFSDFGVSSPGMGLADAVDLMRSRDIGALLVTGPESNLLGIFTERDAFNIVAKTYR
jgi:CBS domain-containing protein